MSISFSHTILRIFSVIALLGAWLSVGCGSSGPAVHSVKGQVQLVGGDSSPLVGHMLEVTKADDKLVRSYGEIKADGNFELESLIAGEIHKGAKEGKYQARIVLADDDPAVKQQARAALHPRYLAFESSGLAFEVPAKTPVQLQVSRR
ncbi:hypothetical protein ETAA8_10490 [Anatilimnocola aggregata]|uniref:Carboxypeptidase regulatory-like domain-containing protein n=1 Tax=Anatilimnocola aggregata TaxID=2528021 RepID=A0A517Y6W0_9BACT|nr:hypothetical protein [Anatilimnocola aggregata]QDU25977.1 hypothetical protein ETAA8_10490 [Anatilimnocola aggregata]